MTDWRNEWEKRKRPESYVEPAKDKPDRAPKAPAENHDLRWLWGGACEVDTGARRNSPLPSGTSAESPTTIASAALERERKLRRAFGPLPVRYRAALHGCYDPHGGRMHEEAEAEHSEKWGKWGPAARVIAALWLDKGPLSPAEVLAIVRLASEAHAAFAAALDVVEAAIAKDIADARAAGQAKTACRLARIYASAETKARKAKDRLVAWLAESGLGIGP